MLSAGFWVPILANAGIGAIVALGVYVTLLSGQASVAHAAMMGIAGYLSAVLTTNLGLPFPVAFVAGVLAAATTGALLSVVTMRMSELVVALTTIGFGETAVVIAFNTDYLGGAQSFSGIPLKTTFLLILVAVGVVTFFTWRLDHSRLGLAARAIRDDRQAAAAMGIDVPRIRILTFAVGAAFAGVGGVLSAHYFLVINPNDLSFFHSFTFKMFVLFGGSYIFFGPLAGALILTVLPELFRIAFDLSASTSQSFRFMALGLVIVIVIIKRPNGLIDRIPIGGPAPHWLSWLERLWSRILPKRLQRHSAALPPTDERAPQRADRES